MLGVALKQFAKEQGLTCDRGIAYGEYRGYLLTLEEGRGIKYASFTMHCNSAEQRERLAGWLTDKSLYKEYYLTRSEVTDNTVRLLFSGAKAASAKFAAGVAAVADKLKELNIPGITVCAHCGQPQLGGSYRRLLLSGAVYAVHEQCGQRWASDRSEQVADNRREGSVLAGLAGALLGGAVGAIPWGVAYYFNWFASVLGILIGFCAVKGYDLLRGKQTGIKTVIVAIVAALCVILSQFIALAISTQQGIAAEYQVTISFVESMQVVFATLLEVPGALGAVAKDVLLGLLFAALGIFPTLNRSRQELKATNERATLLD